MNQDLNSTSSQYSTPVIVLKYAVLAAITFCVCMSFVVAQNDKEFLLSILGTACLIVVAIPLFAQREVSIFEPLVIMILLVLVGVPIKLIYILWVRNDDLFVSEHVLLQQQPEIFLKGTFVVLIGYILFVLGYMIRFPKAPLEPLFLPKINEWNGKRLQLAVGAIAVIAMLSFVAFIFNAGVSFRSFTEMSQKRFLDIRADGGERMHSTIYILCRGAALSKFIVYFCLIWLIHNKKSIFSGMGILLIMAVMQTIFLAVVINSRAGVALLLLDCAVLSYYLYRTIDIKLIAVCLSVALLIMIPMLAARGQRQDRNINTSVGKLFQKTLSGRNMLDIAKCCHIINGVPRKMEYRNGEMLWAWMAAPVPTSYWPDKPRWANQGLTVNRQIFEYRGDLSGCPPGLIGELQWNFGYAGIWVGMFLAGLIFRQIFLAFYAHRFNPTSILIYTMILTRFVLFSLGNDLGTGIVKTGLDMVPACMVLFFIGMHRRPVIEQKEAPAVRRVEPVPAQMELIN